jgi:hypothetical protein
MGWLATTRPIWLWRCGFLNQVVVGTNLAQRTDREGRRLSRSSDGLQSILVFGQGVELLFAGNEVLIQKNLGGKVTEVAGGAVVASADHSNLTMSTLVRLSPTLTLQHR